jgi:D-glycero-alpha-D-manno-heptose 1-phosphate guanylyltransferase
LKNQLIFERPPLIVLAGGFGTRLQSILKGNPKPLADINGVPFLQLLFVNWLNHGFRKFFLSLHFESDKIIKLVNELKKTILEDCEVKFIVEETPLGTGGAVSFVVNELNLDGDIFIVNADTWIDSGYQTLDKEHGNFIGVVKINDISRYGKVVMDNDHKIVRFEEKNEKETSGLINAGVYKLSTNIFASWDGKAYSLERDLFPNLIHNKLLNGIELKTNFIDIGIPEDYLRFCNWRKF